MITTERNVPLAAHTTQALKDALTAEAKRRDASVSATIHDLLRKQLNALGYQIAKLKGE